MSVAIRKNDTASLKIEQLRREAVESYIEQLIGLLDEIDGDENLEPYLADTYPDHSISFVDLEEDDERERDDSEYGIADEGGLAEQAPSYIADLNLALYAI
ncbi:hypothetical protein [Rhizobium sp. 60-20]|uniref:hypothetical protein n=1 Tax=Rhizobium sp. 60-20 TaxID=1895819 RepID=UPI00092B2CB7|nr:hypothetical protein [Rhizobium sp. 60-20]OJY66445.1 MAG: hypothetical protein BGP09_31465 [Rhizobium sp. 60-20]